MHARSSCGTLGAMLAAIRVLVACALVACTAAAPDPPGETLLIDLTHAFDAETLYWPTEEGFVREPGFAGRSEGGYWYAAGRFRAAEHGGTHLDAPIHFGEGRPTVDTIPLERLVAPGRVVDARDACTRDPDHRVDLADLAAHEARYGTLPEGSIVLLHTGWGRRWPERAAYLGTDRRGPEAVAELRFPGLHPDAARRLIERGVAAVGIDTASIDHGPSADFASHRVLAAHDVPVFENVAQLDALPAVGFQVIALPLKIRGGTGAPLRIVALLGSGEAP
jgi:kynurenine formamidase